MNQTIKNILGGTVALAVLLIGYAAVNYANSYGKSIQPSSFRSFSVAGNGKAIAIPDVAEFSFQVITEGGEDIASLKSQNTIATNKAIAFVKSKEIEDKDIKTKYYNVDPRYQIYNCNPVPPPMPMMYNAPSAGQSAGSATAFPSMPIRTCPPSSIVGYTITQSVDVKIRDFKKIGDILGGVVSNGANQVGALSFTIDDPSAVQGRARADAIAKAKTQAEVIAQAGGFNIGRLLGIQEGYNSYPVYNNFGTGMAVGVDKSVSVPAPVIQPGSQEVNVTMTLQYEIE